MQSLPLKNLKVLEFTHAVMGPTCGLILADMGAEVIHIEPIEGDSTRRLKGFGTGYFPFYNRNKKSLAIDIKSAEGREIVAKMVGEADILVENFGPGTMDRLGFGYEKLAQNHPKLIYCALKGFLSGPYEHRHAMDEVVQMMGGLAYMTGRPGDPLRAGTSVVDITGGMFGAMGILAALHNLNQTGKGSFVKAALFETTAFLMGQHMAYGAITQLPVPPMPARVSAWSIYKTFVSAGGELVFIGIISEKHWVRFCEAFERADWLADPRLATNNQRIDERDWFLPQLDAFMLGFSKAEIIEHCEKADIPVAPIARPEDLFEDPQLNAGGSLLETTDTVFALQHNPPQIGEHTAEILREAGYSEAEITALKEKGIIAY
jgi:crotonobetainyl-CoA:carnitine CoA-transferase CaiB-like acyl-CoA transferase